MSQDGCLPSVRQSSPLAVPLLIVSIVAVAEAIGLIFVIAALARRPEPAKSASQAVAQGDTGGAAASGEGSNQAGIRGRGYALGKTGERVESAGFGITVEQIKHEPVYKNLADWGNDYRYLALLIVVENNSGGNADLLPATFRLQDDQGYPYKQLGVKLTEPKLGINVLGNGEKVRGYLDFVVPKTAKGLKLIYSGVPTRNSEPIHVELGE